jgi:hypothetical protein
MSSNKRTIIEIENVLHPGKIYRVDAYKYEAMKAAFLKILPAEAPGLSGTQVIEQVKPHLPEDLFPGGSTVGWWVAAVQLDLAAKGFIVRVGTRPVCFYRA